MQRRGNVAALLTIALFASFLARRTNAGLLPDDVCSKIKKVEVVYKDYFEMYLGNNMFVQNLGQRGLYVSVLNSVIPACCDGTKVEYQFMEPGITMNDERKEIEGAIVEHLVTSTDYARGVYRFYHPEFADKGLRTIYDSQREFVRLGSSPGHAIMMRTPPPIEPVFVGEIFVKSWAIMIFLITFAWIIGILLWMADHYKNPKDFPNPFYVGMFEAFWWSVITMTTVGYGDKAPKSLLGRLLAVVWIMISTVFLSLFTANATSILAMSQAEEDHSITLGKRVGVLNSKHYVDFALNLGAEFVSFPTQLDMITGIQDDSIDRFMAPNYLDFMLMAQQGGFGDLFRLTNVLDHPFQIGMVLARDSTNLSHVDDKLLSCLRSSISSFEKLQRSDTDLSTLSLSMADRKESSTALDNDSLLNLTYYCFMIVAVLVLIGVGWDGWKYYKKKKRMLAQQSRAADVETGGDTVAEIHDIPSTTSTPNMAGWETSAAVASGDAYKMSIVPGYGDQPLVENSDVMEVSDARSKSRESFEGITKTG